MFTANDVKTLRERTGAGMMDCKKALTQCDGDMEKAIDFLREKGLAAAAKKAGRIAAEGVVVDYRGENASSLVEVNCETDFVAKTDKFVDFAKMIAKHVAETNPADMDALMASTIDGTSVTDLVSTAVAGIGEKISIRRFIRVEGVVDTYIHLGGKIGVITQFDKAADAQKMHDVSMHIAAMNPMCIDESGLPEEYKAHEKEIQLKKALDENAQLAKPKPSEIVEKMVAGRLNKEFQQVCLMNQPFVKDQGISVAQYVGGDAAVLSFTRFEMGEGLQKREDNFAEEVASQMKA